LPELRQAKVLARFHLRNGVSMALKNVFEDGDNIVLLKELPANSIQTCYMDPPYNSGRDYNVVVEGCPTQEQAYKDTWSYDEGDFQALGDESSEPDVALGCDKAYQYLHALRPVLLGNDESTLGYCVHIARRLFQVHRVLNSTGTLVFHCDTRACGYINVLLDLIFGRANQQAHIIWKRTGSHGGRTNRETRVHDHLFRYTKTQDFVWNSEYAYHGKTDNFEARFKYKDPDGRKWRLVCLTGSDHVVNGPSGKPWKEFDPTTFGKKPRNWAVSMNGALAEEYLKVTGNALLGDTPQERLDALDKVGLIVWPKKKGGFPSGKLYLDSRQGVPLQDLWVDIDRLSANSHEKLSFEGQKPVELLERIILLTTNVGDTVLDPYAGTGTTAVAASKHGRGFICYELIPQSAAIGRDRIKRECGQWTEDNFIPADMTGVRRQIDRAYRAVKEGDHGLALDLRHALQVWAVEIMLRGHSNGRGADKGFDGWINYIEHDSGERRECLVQIKSGKSGPGDVARLKDALKDRPLAKFGLFVAPNEPTKDMKESAFKAGTLACGPKESTTIYPVIQFARLEDLFKPELGGRLLGGNLLLPGHVVRSDPRTTPEALRRHEQRAEVEFRDRLADALDEMSQE
jgi:DNA modification methylase